MKRFGRAILLCAFMVLLCSCEGVGNGETNNMYEHMASDMMPYAVFQKPMKQEAQEINEIDVPENLNGAYSSDNQDVIKINHDYDTCLRLCQDASDAYVSLLKNHEQDIDFSNYIVDSQLAEYVLFRAKSYPHGVCAPDCRFFLTSYENISNEYVYVRGQISVQSGTTIENLGENIFILKNENGRIVIKDWYHDNPDSLDAMYRLNEYKSIEDARFWECEEKYGPFLKQVMTE